MPENGTGKGVSLGETYYDSDIYDNAGHGGKSRYDGYVTSIAANDEVEDEDVENVPVTQKRPGYTAPASLLNDIAQVYNMPGLKPQTFKVMLLKSLFDTFLLQSDKDYDPFADKRRPTIADREDEYRQKRRRMIISPERNDPFAEGMLILDMCLYTKVMNSLMNSE